MTNNDSFLPENYVQPLGNANYMKFEKGENKIRILSKPILGYVDWKDKQPIRFKMDAKPSKSIDPAKPIKFFWAFVVWNYKKECVQILEITQSGIQNAITSLTKDADWGSPFEYDLKIMRDGDGMETTYQVNPVPHKPTSKEILTAYKSKPINLEALYTGGDPFAPAIQTPVNDIF